jgi:hypothetical protein
VGGGYVKAGELFEYPITFAWKPHRNSISTKKPIMAVAAVTRRFSV